jgi:hypothetical protein
MNIETRYNENEPKYNALLDELKDLFDDEETGGGAGGDDNNEDDNTGNEGDKNEDTNDTQGGAGGAGVGEDTDDDGDSNGGPTEELTENQKKQLQKAMEKQKEFLDGDTKKTKMSKKDKNLMDGIENSDASVETVEGGYGGETKVVVIRKINEKNRGVCDMYRKWDTYDMGQGRNNKNPIEDGFRLGTMLGKKLRVRNDDIKTQYNRQRRGAIDRRLLAELGVGNTKIFEKSYVTTSNDAGIHISIDASGSMGGTRFQNAMTTAIAVARAADMVGGIRVRIDLRSDCSAPGLNQGTWGGPVVMVIYDSKTQNMAHIKKNFPYLQCGGGTPEGLCFAAIRDIITQGGKDTDKYFINMSDGAPCRSAVPITKKEVKSYKASGLKVMSYFISGYGDPGESTRDMFDGMYGKDSTEYIDTTNIVQIAKTLNKLLSERG